MTKTTAGDDRIRVVHLIDTLHTGGAEKVVMTLAAFMNREKFDTEIWCSEYNNIHKAEMDRVGVPVKTVPLKRFGYCIHFINLQKR